MKRNFNIAVGHRFIDGLVIIISAVLLVECAMTQPQESAELPKPKTPDIPILDAVSEGNIDVVRMYFADGLDLNLKYEEWNSTTLLHRAVAADQEEIVKLLIDKGADINAKDINSNTPLSLTGIHGNVSVADLLVSAGADLNHKGFGGWTPLHMAAFKGHINLVNYFVTIRGAEVEIKDDGGTTALHCAAFKGHDNVICLLFIKDADVNAMGDEGTTPLDAAIEGGQHESATLIRSIGGMTFEELKAEYSKRTRA